MGKYRISHDYDEYDDYETYEKFTKSNRKQSRNEDDAFESQGESPKRRKSDSYISKRTKGRSRR